MSDIQVLKNLGSDQFSNLFEIIIPVVSGVEGFEGLSFRVTNFPIPETPRPAKYRVHYKTLSLEKLGSKIEVENELTFQLRIDKFNFAYDFFRTWKQLGISQYTGVLDEELIPKVPITVKSVGPNEGEITGGQWTFEDAYPLAIGGIDFNQEGSDPTIRDIVLQFSIMNDTIRAV